MVNTMSLYESLKNVLYNNPLWKKVWDSKTPEQIFNVHWDYDLEPEHRKLFTPDVLNVLKYMAVTYYYLGFNAQLVMTNHLSEAMKKKGKTVDRETLDAFVLEKMADFVQTQFDSTVVYGKNISPANSVLRFIADVMMRDKDVLIAASKCTCPNCQAARNRKNKDKDVTQLLEEEMKGCDCATPPAIDPESIKIIKLKKLSEEELKDPAAFGKMIDEVMKEEIEKNNLRNQGKNN